jgi:hypothetical protein
MEYNQGDIVKVAVQIAREQGVDLASELPLGVTEVDNLSCKPGITGWNVTFRRNAPEGSSPLPYLLVEVYAGSKGLIASIPRML